MRKLLICALALGGFAASAQAADLSIDSLKDPLPDTISYHGVTIYGTVDVGYGYNSNGAPASGNLYAAESFMEYGNKMGREAFSSLTNNALSQSQIGVKVEESLGMGFVGIGKIDTGFNPAYGTLADACQSLVVNNGKNVNNWTVAGDGSRCGQAFNGQAYAGLSNSSYGTLTVGRQNTLDMDVMSAYDPMAMSYAFSLLGYSGGPGAGIGDTETARWDNAIKYVYQFGPVHAGGMYASGGQDSSIQNNAYGANVGATYKGFSLDAVYTKENGAVSMGSQGYSNTYVTGQTYYAAGTCNPGAAGGASGSATGGNVCTNGLNATITDNEAYTVAGKYVYDLGGGYKDEGSSSKLTFFGGYQHSELTDPSKSVAVGSTTIGGYQMVTVNNSPYNAGQSKILQTEWAGAKYEVGAWAFTGAYYHESQNSYNSPTAANCQSQPNSTTGNAIKSNCSGDINVVSGLVDYAFNKHFDVYGGVTWSSAAGGFTSGFANSTLQDTSVLTGLRLKF